MDDLHIEIGEVFNPLVPIVAKYPTKRVSLLYKEDHHETLLYKFPINS